MIRWLLSLHVVTLQLWLIVFAVLVWFGILGLLYLAAHPTGRERRAIPWQAFRPWVKRYAYRGTRRPRHW